MRESLYTLKRVQDAVVTGKSVLVRVDYNVPLKEGQVADDTRIRASLPTLKNLIERGAKLVLLSHLGRPEGKVVAELRLDRVAERLKVLLERPVYKLDDCIGEEVSKRIQQGKAKDVFLLENVRFYPEETENDADFARHLAGLADLFVNEAFATIHRAHASTLGVTHFLPSYAGLLIQKEIEALSRLIDAPQRPYIAIVGGKKAESKIGVLRDLIDHVNAILIGGGVAFTFLRAEGYSIGDSLVDEALLEETTTLLKKAAEKDVSILLPKDVVAARKAEASAETSIFSVERIPPGWIGLDIGPETIRQFRGEINKAKTVVWTGPMGAFELPAFSRGTEAIAEGLAHSQAFTVIGGGETGEAVSKAGFTEGISYISTGGGACLALLRGKALPALDALCQ
jgi:phosphoglycerate kinase